MNIQIFGTKKSNDSKKAERFFKERGIRFQYIDMKEKGLIRGEFQSVLAAVGGLDALIDPQARDREVLDLLPHLSPSDAEDKVFENQQVLRLPIVRNGRQATVGCQPDVWKTWE